MEQDKYEKLLFSIRMLHFHNYISFSEFEKMIKKLEREKNKED